MKLQTKLTYVGKILENEKKSESLLNTLSTTFYEKKVKLRNNDINYTIFHLNTSYFVEKINEMESQEVKLQQRIAQIAVNNMGLKTQNIPKTDLIEEFEEFKKLIKTFSNGSYALIINPDLEKNRGIDIEYIQELFNINPTILVDEESENDKIGDLYLASNLENALKQVSEILIKEYENK